MSESINMGEVDVQLETRDGQLVDKIKIPYMKMMPEVIQYGLRYYAQANISFDCPIYREIFFFKVVGKYV